MNKGLTGAIKLTMIFIVLLVSFFFIYNFVIQTNAEPLTPIWTTDEYGVLKADFAPEEIVYIHGSNFLTNNNVDVSVARPDGTIDSGNSYSDETGSFVYNYQLDGIEGLYNVFATDGTNTAETTFTDSFDVNTVCKDLGFDFGVVKWEWKSGWSPEGGDNKGTSVTGSNTVTNWSVGTSVADGIVVKAGSTVLYAVNGENGTVYQSSPATSFIAFCGYNETCNENEKLTEFTYESKPNTVRVDSSTTNVSFKLCNSTEIPVDTSDGKEHYIYMNWSLGDISGYKGAVYFDLMLYHKEDSTFIKVQLKNQSGAWVNVCDPSESSSYIWSTCNLKPYWNILKNVPVIQLRVVAKNSGACHEYLGCAKLKLKLYKCEPTEFCGDNIVEPPEECELPNTNNNPFCTQTTTDCLGKKLGQRDAYGNCDSLCGCIDDPFKHSCVLGQCGAECDDIEDCQNKCVNDVRYYSGNCLDSCECSYTTEDCNKDDGCYAYENGCEQRDYFCVVDGCQYNFYDRNTDYNDDYQFYCSDSTVRKHRLFHDFFCDGTCKDHTSWTDDQLVENCDLKDGWYDTGKTQWTPVGECADKEQKEQEYRDYTCVDAACDYKITKYQWVDTGNMKYKELSTPCEADDNKCTIDHCDGLGKCVKKENVDCSGLNNQCQEGVCNPSDGKCYPDYSNYPLSTPCEADSSECTVDHCNGSGSCVFWKDVIVSGPQQCKSFYCDPKDGKVKEDYTDFPLSTPCPSGDVCEINHCDGLGKCVFWKDVPIPSKPIKTIGDPKTKCNEGEWCEWRITILTPITLTCEEGKIYWRYALDGEWKKWNDDGSSVTIYFPEESNHTLEAYCLNDCDESDHDIEKFKVEGTAFEIPLYKKWNLISVPFVLFNNAPAEVFKNISDKIVSVWTYDNGNWYVWIPGLGGTLTSIKPGWGYWVIAKEDTKLLISGNLFSPITTPPSKELQNGWNLIGYYGTEWQIYELEEDNVCGYINPVYGNYVYCSLNSLIDTQRGFPRWSSLWGYDNCGEDVAYWHQLESCTGEHWSDNRMYAGKGYWIEMDVKDSYAPATNCIWDEDMHCSFPTI